MWLRVLQMLLIPCSIRNNLILLMVGWARRVSSHQGTTGQMGSSPEGRYNSTNIPVGAGVEPGGDGAT
jgi:hypothetical protein